MEGFVRVGRLQDFPERRGRAVRLGGEAVAVFRVGRRVFALRDACPHKQGPLSQGIVHGTTVTCPLHNWKIDLASGKALGPDEGCTNVYAVKVENGRVFLALRAAEAAA